MADVEMVPTLLLDQWTLLLPKHRAERGETWGSWWPYWEWPRIQSMYRNLTPGDAIYDIGAEEGDWPALWALWGCDVFMAEPNPRVWPNIKAIFEANGLNDRVRGTFVGFIGEAWHPSSEEWLAEWGLPIHAGAVWPSCAFGVPIGDHGFLNLHERPEVPALPLDDLTESYGAPTAVTMDVEGAELRVLRGAARTLDNYRPLLWISVHPYMLHDLYGESPDTVREFLRVHGYMVEHLASEHEFHWFAYPEERADTVVLPYGRS